MKKQLEQDMISFIEPFRDKLKPYQPTKLTCRSLDCMGKEKTQENVAKAIREVRGIIGFKQF